MRANDMLRGREGSSVTPGHDGGRACSRTGRYCIKRQLTGSHGGEANFACLSASELLQPMPHLCMSWKGDFQLSLHIKLYPNSM